MTTERTFELTSNEWAALEELATETSAAFVGDASWQSLIKRIASGDFVLIAVSDIENPPE